MDLKVLLEPIRIGSMTVSNRIVFPAMSTHFATVDGRVTDQLINYYRERARGGAGLIVVENIAVSPNGKATPLMPCIYDDDYMEGLQRLVEAIKGTGAKVAFQLSHAGRQTLSILTNSQPVAPSSIPCPVRKEMPHPLSIPEIRNLVDDFAISAQRSKEAGADAVELHMAHGYLINQFLSPFSNIREDRYGGSTANRVRFAAEILREIRKRVGENFPIICRISADEYVEGGLDLDESKKIAKMLEEEGADAIHVSAGNNKSYYMSIPPYYLKEGCFRHLARGIKSIVNLPVIVAGRIRTPLVAAEIITAADADLVAMGRALIADASLPQKVSRKRLHEIRPCLSCNRCIESLLKGKLKCTVNPRLGSEDEDLIPRSERRKKVLVIGGGPGGMQAATVAAKRGHDVVLMDEREELGGDLNLASLPPEKGLFKELIEFMASQLNKHGVKISLIARVTADLVKEIGPDAVIVATGSTPVWPDIPGIEGECVVSDRSLLQGKVEVGRKVLVVGGGAFGSEVADYLAERGKEVTIVEMKERIAQGLPASIRHLLKERLKQKGVEVLTSTKIRSLAQGYVEIEDAEGLRRLNGFDHIVISTGSKSNDEIATEIKGMVPEAYLIGDALRPREAMYAIAEGDEIGRKI